MKANDNSSVISHTSAYVRSTCAYLEQVGAFSKSQTANILNQALSVRVSDGSVHIHSHLVDPVDEFTVKGTEQILLHHMFLRRRRIKGHR